ncbi:MAG TPA: beta-L-arabinofuranosidase domain-containing protein, partial [Tepidisphaeraceae bacterium]
MMNRRMWLVMGGFAWAVAGLARMARAEAAPPRARLSEVPIQSVTIDDPFWSPKLAVWRRMTIVDCLDKFDRDGAMANFDHIARGELTANHGGPPWYDGLIYEMIRAAGDSLEEQPDPALEARVDGMIDRISAAAAHDPDGYVNTYTQMKEPSHRWGQNGGNDLWQHDLYNAGALVDAGVHYYRATGKTKLLETAVRLANLMCREMGPPPRHNIIPGHAIGEEAMVGLYQLLQQQPALKERLHVPVEPGKYLELAQFWIDARGHHEGRKDFGAYDQDDVPVLQQTAIEGHAVRAALMCSGLTSLAMATGRSDYADASQRLWASMTGRRMYVTGGVGSFAKEERFGPDYALPNNGYAETCAAVANGFFDRNINLATGDAAAADELERALYNGALSGVSLAGNSYFYENPLEASRSRLRWPWHACPCCPPMFLKLMSALPGYVYATDSTGGVFVNLYIGSEAKIAASGGRVSLKQATRYPWDGAVRLTISPSQATAFDLSLRIPGWCRGGPAAGGLYTTDPAGADAFIVTINGQPVTSFDTVRGYARLHRTWQPGDVVEVHMAVPVERVKADPRVEADRGRVALMRGPIVYCLESVDNGGRVRDLFLPDTAPVSAEDRPDLLGDVTVLHASGRRVPYGSGGSDAPADITAIPYYANANRGPVSMIVWIPTASSGVSAGS